jgi:hypothetical protein
MDMTHLQLLAAPISRRYRLVDAALQPHPQLDGLYESLDAALEEALAWCSNLAASHARSIGVEVSTLSGGWRTVRFPQPLL